MGSHDIPHENGTEERIKSAAIRLFGAQGFAATGIRQIARASDISVASLYHYMETKDDLLLSLMLDGMNALLEASIPMMEQEKEPSERLDALVRLHIKFHCERAALARVTDIELRSLTGKARQRVVAMRDDYEHLWLTTINDGVQQGVFHAPQPRLATFALLEMCTGVSHWYTPNGTYSVAEIADCYSGLAHRMLEGELASDRTPSPPSRRRAAGS